MNKENDENFESSTKCWICDITFVKGEVEIRDQCHIKRNYRDAVHRDCDVSISLNCKNSIVFHNPNIMMRIFLCKNFENLILK